MFAVCLALGTRQTRAFAVCMAGGTRQTQSCRATRPPCTSARRPRPACPPGQPRPPATARRASRPPRSAAGPARLPWARSAAHGKHLPRHQSKASKWSSPIGSKIVCRIIPLSPKSRPPALLLLCLSSLSLCVVLNDGHMGGGGGIGP